MLSTFVRSVSTDRRRRTPILISTRLLVTPNSELLDASHRAPNHIAPSRATVPNGSASSADHGEQPEAEQQPGSYQYRPMQRPTVSDLYSREQG